MTMRNWKSRACAAAMIVAAVAVSPAAAQSRPGDAARGRSVFQAQCGVCHSVVAGKTLVGPSLAGVVGQTVGKARGFAYSPAMAKAGFKWDTTRLDAYLAAPAKAVPGNRMPYAGLTDATKRRDLIAYLATAR